jgi:DNA mismatch repair ATPase MutL
MRVSKICGDLFLEHALSLEEKAVGLQLRGWIGFPESSRRQADCQYFFVNNRIVRDRLINHLVKTVYQAQSEMVEGAYPCYALYLNLDPSEVDVNVHPTKQEVRFRETRLVHDFILKSLQVALSQNKTNISYPISSVPAYAAPCEKGGAIKVAPFTPSEEPIPFSSQYALLEDQRGVYVIALSFVKNQLLTNYFKEEAENISRKILLFPCRVEGVKTLNEKALALLKTFGFILSQKENGCFVIEQPAFLKTQINPAHFLVCIEALLKEGQEAFLAKLVQILNVLDLKNLAPEKLNALLQRLTQSHNVGWVYVKHEEIPCSV